MPKIEVTKQCCCVCGSEKYQPVATGRDVEYFTSEQTYDFVCCEGCNHLYLLDVPTKQMLPIIYPDNYMNYGEAREKSLAFRVKNWLDRRAIHKVLKGKNAPQAVLDVGCADGMLLDVLKVLYPHVELAGVEMAEKPAQRARQKGHAVSVGNAEGVPLPKEKYDLIFMQQVIEHVHHPQQLLQKLRQALTADGYIWIETPTWECVDAKWFKKRYWGGYHIPRHFNIFSASGLAKMAQKEGLQVERVIYKPQPVHWIWSCHHYLQDKGYPKWLYERFHLKNPVLLGVFTVVELLAKVTTGRASNMVVILKKAN